MNEQEKTWLNEEERWLNGWYKKCRNKYIDLCNFGGSELFVIEGDSLLFKFLYDPETDFIDFSQSFAGGQYLALTFLVENFLKKFKERECTFHVVFFDVHQSIWNNRPELRLSREIIINHLKSQNTKISVFEFKSWWSEEWKKYLDEKQPLFILTGDGSTEHLEVKESENYVEEENNSSISGIATKNSLSMTIVLRAFMFSTLNIDIPVALISGMNFRDSRVYAFVFERAGNVDLKTIKKLPDIEKFATKAREVYDEKSNWLNDSVASFKLSTEIKNLLSSQECLQIWTDGGKKIVLILLSLTGVLCNNNNPDFRYFQYLARVFLLHIILLDYLPLTSRAVPPIDDENTNIGHKKKIELFLQNFYAYCTEIYISGIYHEATETFQDLSNNLYDLIDTRLFVSLIQCQYEGLLNFNVLPIRIKEQFDACWNILKRFCENNGLNSLKDNIDEKFQIASYEKSYLENDNEASLCPFKYEFFEECLGSMRLGLPENQKEIDEGQYGSIGDCSYDDSTYCYSLKPTKDSRTRSAAYYERHKTSLERKGYQQYVRFLEKYAESLSGTQGYYRQKIIVDRSNKKETSKSSSKPSTKSGSKSSKKESTGAKKIREKIEQDKLVKNLETSDRYFDDAFKEISKDGNIRNQLNSLNAKLEKTEKIKHPFTMFRGQFKKLELLLKLWTEQCMSSNSSMKKDFSVAVDIMRQVFYIVQNFKNCLDNKRKEILSEVLIRLKLTNCKNYLKKIPTEVKEKPPSFKFDFPSQWADLSVGTSDAKFQMLYAGHLMDRNTNSVDDPRVSHFKPDDWQVKVLDVIDNEESALICCPTSAGKTFISFYAMEKVLRESDDGILVYVSPTKALVNQVTAEVYGRFEKSYNYGDKTTWGIYTREYRENHDKCQILVTIPQMLESLIFSPYRASWARNIKRIIFDEVHVIGTDGGEYYDRLLLLSKSIPILALSATIGNPEPFKEWIAKPKSLRGHQMKLIKTTKRFSDLQQYVYLPKFPLPLLLETTVNPKERQNSVVPINPVFSLSMNVLKENGFPGDMKLVPSQCVQLWEVMKKHSGDNPPDGLDKLNPDVYFKDIGYIVKDDADRYEQEIKEIFTKCARDDSFDGIIESTIKELGTDIKNGFEGLESTANKLANELDVYGDKFLEEGIVPLLCELSAQDKLPAILFHFDEKGCVELARHILEQLESAEEEKRANDPEYQAKKKAAMSQQEAYEKDLKRRRDKKSSAQEDPQEPEEPIQPFFDWEAHDPDFTFVDKRGKVTSEEFEEIVDPSRQKMNESKLLISALQRGIGVHHTDLPRKYLSAVEILFRRRHLRVIIATGTLALGINMPCKTTVFVGDSISLTALQYRQMSGRSGRRGFDPLGHVVFFGITLAKIKRLLLSELPNLSRHFPLTTTLALRSFNLLNQCKSKNEDHEYAKDAVKGLFGEPFIFLGKEYKPVRIKFQLRFSIEYLMRENLLDQTGNLINLSAMTSHLNYTEPSNFAFAVLYKHGVFHRICSKSRTNEEMMNDLVLILSNLFNRLKLRKISRDWYQNDDYTSKIILPPLPKDINDMLEKHNKRVLETYTDYVVTFARNMMAKLGQVDNALPLSSIKIPPKSMDENLLEDPLISKLKSMAISFIARSPFIAMCGSLGDIFNNLEDLTSHVRREIYLDINSIPFIKTNEVLNAYISDFFSNGHEKALVEANGIRRGEVWQVLNDFNGVLSSIIVSLRNRNFGTQGILEDGDEPVLKGFEMVWEHFMEKFRKTWV